MSPTLVFLLIGAVGVFSLARDLRHGVAQEHGAFAVSIETKPGWYLFLIAVKLAVISLSAAEVLHAYGLIVFDPLDLVRGR